MPTTPQLTLCHQVAASCRPFYRSPAGSTRDRARGARETCTLWPQVRVRRSDSIPSPKSTRDSLPTTRLSSSPSPRIPSVQLVPVWGEGQASRTNHARECEVGAGRSPMCRPRFREAPQPVAPVPVETTTPEEDWRSAREPKVSS